MSYYPSDSYIKGQWNVICDRCGQKIKSSKTRKDGYNAGLIVCNKCWDRRPPGEDPVHLPKDSQPVPGARPPPTPIIASASRIVWDTAYITWDDDFSSYEWDDM